MRQPLHLREKGVHQPHLCLWGRIIHLVKNQHELLGGDLPQIFHKAACQVWNDPIGIVFSITTPCANNRQQRLQSSDLNLRLVDPGGIRQVKLGEMLPPKLPTGIMKMDNDSLLCITYS